MNKNLDLQYFLELTYEIKLIKKDGIYWLFIPELSCVAKDVDLENAYEKLEFEKEEHFKKMIDSGMGKYIVDPRQKKIKQKIMTKLIPYGIRYFIIVIMIIIAIQFFREFITISRVKYVNKEYISKRVAEMVVMGVDEYNKIVDAKNDSASIRVIDDEK